MVGTVKHGGGGRVSVWCAFGSKRVAQSYFGKFNHTKMLFT